MNADTPPARCPVCDRRSDPVFRPFCSKRCADVDLQRWLTGRYAIPAAEGESDGELARDAGQDEDRPL